MSVRTRKKSPRTTSSVHCGSVHNIVPVGISTTVIPRSMGRSGETNPCIKSTGSPSTRSIPLHHRCSSTGLVAGFAVENSSAKNETWRCSVSRSSPISLPFTAGWTRQTFLPGVNVVAASPSDTPEVGFHCHDGECAVTERVLCCQAHLAEGL
ncbi:MAG: hypothetical protein MZV64_49175 [Ignavibacteriales bacterium]|nr:hypothetical protein [Ignavibacteriales bacterium]